MKTKARLVALFLLLVVSSSRTFSQNNETMFNSKTKVGVMLSTNIGYARLAKADVALHNSRLGVVFNDRFTVGGFYNMSLNQFIPQSETIPDVYMDYKVGGAFLEYTIFSDKLIHATFPIFAGMGRVEMDGDDHDPSLGRQNFYTLEPGVLCEINVYDYVRVNVGATYRFVSKMNYRSWNQNDFSGIGAQVGIKIGWFRK